MIDRLAIKRLTASDLTLFEPLFRTLDAGNQKSINLNRDVFVDALYPGLGTQGTGIEIPVSLTIYGPTGARPHKAARKIVKNSTYRNWRLNGEFIRNPEWDDRLYNILRPDDIAVMSFHGDPLPTAVEIALVAGAVAGEAELFTALSARVAERSMVALTAAELAAVMGDAGVPGSHPINAFAADPELEEALEDAAQDGVGGLSKVRRRLAGRALTAAALAAALARAEQTGRDGEALIDGFMSGRTNKGGTWSHVWVSATNAIAPYDFICITKGGEQGDREWKVEVKSTRGRFESMFHISLGELTEAANSQVPYRLYRVYDLNDGGGKLRRSKDIRSFSESLLIAHRNFMPAGVTVDSFSVSPDVPELGWDEPLHIASPVDDD